MITNTMRFYTTKVVLALTLWPLLMLNTSLLVVAQEDDPCTTARVITDIENRSIEYSAPTSQLKLCDIRLSNAWYRFRGPVDADLAFMRDCRLFKCGTANPVCLNGSEPLPRVSDGVVYRQVCRMSPWNPCSYRWFVGIKNCGAYRVYQLVPTDSCSSAYCISQTRCPTGYCSPTGYTPGCIPCPVNVTLSPVNVTVGNETESSGLISLNTIIFRCKFTMPAKEPDIVYDVHWYINGKPVITYTNMTDSTLEQGWLREGAWSHIRLGMMVKCSVRARGPNGSPTNHFYSEEFFAGIEVNERRMLVAEGESTSLLIRSTVPLPYLQTDTDFADDFELYLFTPSDQSSASCTTSSLASVTFEQNPSCGVRLKASQWDSWQTLNITGVVANRITGDRTTSLRLGVKHNPYQVDGRLLWTNYTIPDIQVTVANVISRGVQGRCQSFNDPHMQTGDGIPWENQRLGEFILYQHHTLPIAVHLKHKICDGTSVTAPIIACHCGVAIRAYNSLLVLDYCSDMTNRTYTTQTRNYMNYQGCDNQHMVIAKQGYNYKVTLPTGTLVEIVMAGPNYITGVIIYHSVADVDSSEGLCGKVSPHGNRGDDFTLRNGSVTSSLEDFANNWRASKDESLFVKIPSLPATIPLRKYCTCTQSQSGLSTNAHCKADVPSASCPQQDSADLHPLLHSCGDRKKRTVGQLDYLTDSPSGWQSVEDIQLYLNWLRAKQAPRPGVTPPEWPVDWTEAKARAHCVEAFRGSNGVHSLQNASGISTSHLIETCILDIKYTGTTIYTKTTLEVYKSAAREEFQRNEVFVNSTEGQELLRAVEENDCVSDCSGHGRCNKKKCVCNSGFAGLACSINLSLPPGDLYIPNEGHCDLRTRPCRSTLVVAKNISEDTPVFCGFRTFQIHRDGTSAIADSLVTTAEPWGPGQVLCPLLDLPPYSRDFIARGLHVRLSNNNITFSEWAAIIIYEAE